MFYSILSERYIEPQQDGPGCGIGKTVDTESLDATGRATGIYLRIEAGVIGDDKQVLAGNGQPNTIDPVGHSRALRPESIAECSIVQP